MEIRDQYYSVILGAGVILLLLLATCSSAPEKEKASQPDDGLGVTVIDPITRDFEEIKESGTLRMITRYSSNTYFLNQGLEWGFEYELVKEFAKTHDLTLDVVVVEPEQNPYDMLNNGIGDVIAANYTITPARKQYVAFTQPYNLVEQILIFSDVLKNPPSSVEEMADRNIPITVRSNSSYFQRLQNLQQAGIAVDIQLEPNKKDTESLLFEVAQGRHLATVADDNIFQAVSIYMNGLMKGPVIAQNDTIGWAVRKNADDLKEQMNTFLNQHFRFAEIGEPPKRSGFLNVLRRRYFEGGSQVAGYYAPESRMAKGGMISPYDELFKKVADSAGVDWLMLAAITAKETQFKPRAKSWTGAVGLMQILPRYSEVKETKMLYDAETNVREGVRIITEHLNHYAYMDSTNQWRFALAAYNAGQGHVADARRLAIDSNKNPNEWQHTADALIKLMDRAYYKNARYGFCRGIETVNYVQDIINRYRTYQSILMMAKDTEENEWPGVLGVFN